MRSIANTVLEHTLGQGVVCKQKRVVRKTKVVRGKEKVVRGAARVVRAPPPRVARDLIFVEIPRHTARGARAGRVVNVDLQPPPRSYLLLTALRIALFTDKPTYMDT